MCRLAFAMAALWLCLLAWTHALAENATNPRPKDDATGVTITLIESKMTEKILLLRYRIVNRSDRDIWVCESVNGSGAFDFEVYLAEDRKTLMARRRLGVSAKGMMWMIEPTGGYARLRAGDARTQSLLLHLPVYFDGVFTGIGLTPTDETLQAERLVLEIGFYAGSLPEIVLDALEGAETAAAETDEDTPSLRMALGGRRDFNWLNELSGDRNEQILVPYTWQKLGNEQVLRLALGQLKIPYVTAPMTPDSIPRPPDVRQCTRLDVECQPSVLDYFFPYADQQALLNRAEKAYLSSQKRITGNDQECLAAFAESLAEGLYARTVSERSTARVVCYRGDERLTSVTIYDGAAVETEGGQRFRYSYWSKLTTSLARLTPQLKSFELRIRCAANLRDLWHRLHVYCDATQSTDSDGSTVIYPAATGWCDAIVGQYVGFNQKAILRPFACPDAGAGKCHYAMNPNCKVDSPGDTVLLFETKAGWNQHGGPELFTFDNHDPKGGCVLLNDGTVKFIRTEEELRRLRWKP